MATLFLTPEHEIENEENCTHMDTHVPFDSLVGITEAQHGG